MAVKLIFITFLNWFIAIQGTNCEIKYIYNSILNHHHLQALAWLTNIPEYVCVMHMCEK